ncbi:MAG: kelch repeat-containing protein [Planctomycetota bacterium]
MLAATALVAASATGQHFAKPPAVDREVVSRVAVPTSTVPRPGTSFGSVYHDGWVYTMGGYTGRPHDYYMEAQSRDFMRINTLDPSQVESLPDTEGLQACPLEAWNNTIIRTGGLVALNSRGEEQTLQSLDIVRGYDVNSGEWIKLPSLPEPRSSHDTAIVGSTLYAIGGWKLDDEAEVRDWHTEVHAIDLSDTASGWTAIDAPFQRRAFATVAVGETIVCIGGITPQNSMSSSVDVYDTASGEWTSGPDYPGSAFGIAAEHHDGVVYASGTDGMVYSWRPGSDSGWEPFSWLTFPRFFHQIAADSSGDLHFIGGISRGMRPTHVETISTADDMPAPGIIAHWKIPSPAAAKNRQGLFMEDGWLYAFGGNTSTGQHDFQPENFLSEGFRLSLASLTWREMPDLPEKRQTIQTVHSPDGKKVLAIGGFGHDGEVARTFDEGFVYSMRDRSWTELGSILPTPRSQFGLTRHGQSYYIFGGLDYDSRREQGDHFRHVLPVLSADASEESIVFDELDIDLPSPRRAFGGASLDGKYFLVGGMRENFQVVDSVDVYDFATGRFTQASPPSTPRLSPSLVALGGKLYLSGGSSPKDGGGFEPNPSIEVYDPATDSWSVFIDEIPITPRHSRMMSYRGRLVLVSSHVDETDMTHVILIEPATGTEHGATAETGEKTASADAR